MDITALQSLRSVVPFYPAQANQPETLAIQSFAKTNGFSYQLTNPELVRYNVSDYRLTPAWLGSAGYLNGKQAYHVVSGNYKGFALLMFSMWDNVADEVIYKKSTEQQQRAYIAQQTAGVIRVKLPKVFPQILLDSNKNDHINSSIRTEYEKNQRLSLEGDFDKYFDLYAPVGLQVNVLTVLAPNMMQIVKDLSGLFDIEFYGDEMIFITRSSLYDPEVMKAIDEALSEQLDYLQRLLTSWNYKPVRSPFDRLAKPYIVGSTMKIGSVRLSAKSQLLLILAGFILFGLIIILTNK